MTSDLQVALREAALKLKRMVDAAFDLATHSYATGERNFDWETPKWCLSLFDPCSITCGTCGSARSVAQSLL